MATHLKGIGDCKANNACRHNPSSNDSEQCSRENYNCPEKFQPKTEPPAQPHQQTRRLAVKESDTSSSNFAAATDYFIKSMFS